MSFLIMAVFIFSFVNLLSPPEASGQTRRRQQSRFRYPMPDFGPARRSTSPSPTSVGARPAPGTNVLNFSPAGFSTEGCENSPEVVTPESAGPVSRAIQDCRERNSRGSSVYARRQSTGLLHYRALVNDGCTQASRDSVNQLQEFSRQVNDQITANFTAASADVLFQRLASNSQAQLSCRINALDAAIANGNVAVLASRIFDNVGAIGAGYVQADQRMANPLFNVQGDCTSCHYGTRASVQANIQQYIAAFPYGHEPAVAAALLNMFKAGRFNAAAYQAALSQTRNNYYGFVPYFESRSRSTPEGGTMYCVDQEFKQFAARSGAIDDMFTDMRRRGVLVSSAGQANPGWAEIQCYMTDTYRDSIDRRNSYVNGLLMAGGIATAAVFALPTGGASLVAAGAGFTVSAVSISEGVREIHEQCHKTEFFVNPSTECNPEAQYTRMINIRDNDACAGAIGMQVLNVAFAGIDAVAILRGTAGLVRGATGEARAVTAEVRAATAVDPASAVAGERVLAGVGEGTGRGTAGTTSEFAGVASTRAENMAAELDTDIADFTARRGRAPTAAERRDLSRQVTQRFERQAAELRSARADVARRRAADTSADSARTAGTTGRRSRETLPRHIPDNTAPKRLADLHIDDPNVTLNPAQERMLAQETFERKAEVDRLIGGRRGRDIHDENAELNRYLERNDLEGYIRNRGFGRERAQNLRESVTIMQRERTVLTRARVNRDLEELRVRGAPAREIECEAANALNSTLAFHSSARCSVVRLTRDISNYCSCGAHGRLGAWVGPCAEHILDYLTPDQLADRDALPTNSARGLQECKRVILRQGTVLVHGGLRPTMSGHGGAAQMFVPAQGMRPRTVDGVLDSSRLDAGATSLQRIGITRADVINGPRMEVTAVAPLHPSPTVTRIFSDARVCGGPTNCSAEDVNAFVLRFNIFSRQHPEQVTDLQRAQFMEWTEWLRGCRSIDVSGSSSYSDLNISIPRCRP